MAVTQRKPVAYNAEITLARDEVALAGPVHLDPDSLLLDKLGALAFPSAAKEDLERDFQFFAYVAGQPGSELVFVTKFNPRRGLRRKRILRWVDEQLTELQEPVLAFDPDRVDLIWSPPNQMAILDLGVFEFLLRDAPEVIAKDPIKVAQLARTVPFSAGSEQQLADAVRGNSRLRRRLLSIVERGHLAGVTRADLQRAFRNGGYRSSDFVDPTGLTVTAVNAATVLQVLNEDIMRGEFSRERFAAERKAPA